jgi:hypothetical protein
MQREDEVTSLAKPSLGIEAVVRLHRTWLAKHDNRAAAVLIFQNSTDFLTNY